MTAVRKYRKLNNFTQSELAKQIGVSKAAISMWENGERNPNIEVLKKLSNIFNISLNEFFLEDNINDNLNSTSEEKDIAIFDIEISSSSIRLTFLGIDEISEAEFKALYDEIYQLATKYRKLREKYYPGFKFISKHDEQTKETDHLMLEETVNRIKNNNE